MAKEKTERDALLVASKVKAYIKSKDFMTSAEAIEGLNEKVYKLIDEALERTKANKRSTVKAADL
ncbi:MAG: hypothetical protein H7A25_18705 [Leptospiraceae bacterium]|nr:hypothetical protein [Leptospiraceae bacterium]MCP5501939.1 hypothetical protein [Leptospiraceae bacterium]